jgi:cobalt-zinc-cadmium efflux system membrane fusion protein
MKNRIYNHITFSLLLCLFACGNAEKEIETVTEEPTDGRIVISKAQFGENKMTLGNLEEKDFPIGIKTNGMIDVPPENKASVNAIMGGYIKSIPLLVGAVVKKGQVLVTIENPEFVKLQQEYLEIKEQLNYLKVEYERQNTLFKEDIISEKNHLKAESLYKSANAKYNGLKKQLSMLNINPLNVEAGNISATVSVFAPISGSITKVNVSNGAYVSPTTEILEIIDNDHIHLELAVFEKDIMSVKKNQHIEFSIPEASNKTYKGNVYLVGTSIDVNRTIKVHGHPQEDAQNFLTGMFVNAEIITDNSTAKALPENAFVKLEGENYILVLDEEKEGNFYFKQGKVDIGKTSNGFTELKGVGILKKDDKVLVDGAFNLIGG